MFHVSCSMTFHIITFGSAAQDILVEPKKLTTLQYAKEASSKEVCFPMGSKIDIEKLSFNSGGGGTNTAATFSLQGFKTAFCGTIGNDISGQEILRELKYLKINTSLVAKTNQKPTNHSIVISGEGKDRTIFAYRGAAELMDIKNIPWKKLKTKWLYLAPLTGLLCDSFEELVDFAQKNTIKVAVNPSITQLSLARFPEIAKKIDILFLNQEEASFLTKIPKENLPEMFKKIQEYCRGAVVITQGGEGVKVSDGKDMYFAVPPKDRNVVDTTGAGDSFASGFLSEFMKSADIEKSVQLGMANSVGCLSQVGAKNGLLKKGEPFERVPVKKMEVL